MTYKCDDGTPVGIPSTRKLSCTPLPFQGVLDGIVQLLQPNVATA